MKRQAGFSLLEILAVLVLLALLLLGVTSGLKALTHSTRAGMAMGQRIDEMRAAQEYLRRALSDTVAYPWALQQGHDAVVFRGDATHMSFVSPGPGYLRTQGLQLQHLTIDGEGSDRHLLLSFDRLATREHAAIVPGQPETLLEHVESGRFVYSGMDDEGKPVTWRADWPYSHRLPTMVGIELKLRDGVSWPTLTVPLRMDVGAANSREATARLLMAASR